MKLAIMQPYFFPYIGYFQLINSVDKFVFYDDVNYIKSGWINRNRLFLAGDVRYITVPVLGASSFKKINKTQVEENKNWAVKIINFIRQNYSNAPFYESVNKLIESIVFSDFESVADLAKLSVINTANYIGIDTKFVLSSVNYKNQEKTGVDRVIDICIIEKSTEYWNLPGGRDLYSPDLFGAHDIGLKFIDVLIEPYQQKNNQFYPCLSIIDVLMYNKPSRVLQMLNVCG